MSGRARVVDQEGKADLNVARAPLKRVETVVRSEEKAAQMRGVDGERRG